MREAKFYKKVGDSVQCNLCRRHCVIPNGEVGVCNVRKNIDGKLYSLNYGINTGLQIDPIEKKPLFHFLPGEKVLSFGTVGCNWKCKFCQNWMTSQSKEIFGEEISPEEIVNLAIENNIKIIGYTYNEPTIFYEYMYDTIEIARKKGLRNIIVTNGYIEEEPLKELKLDAATIDLKTFNPDAYIKLSGGVILDQVLESIKIFKEVVPWIELTFLVIPKWSSKEGIKKFSQWVIENLGDEVPIHFIRYFPAYKMNLPPTPIEMLNDAYNIAKEQGIKYVYLGNVNSKYENTYCPKCGRLLIGRNWYNVKKFFDEKCKCGEKIPGVWK